MLRLFNSCRFSHGPPSDQQQQATFRKRFVIEVRHKDRPSCSWCANWVISLAVRPADEERSRSRSQNSWRNPKILALVHIRCIYDVPNRADNNLIVLLLIYITTPAKPTAE